MRSIHSLQIIILCLLIPAFGLAQTYSINSSGTGTCGGNPGIDANYICDSDGGGATNLGNFTDTNGGGSLTTMSLVVYGACAGDIEFFINGTSIASGTATAGLSCSCQSIAGDPDIPQSYSVTVTPAIQAAYVLGGTNTLSAAATNSAVGTQCFYGADVIVNQALPVELISFEGRYINEDINLSWLTAAELNNEKFQIELSHDGKEFQMVGEVEGKGTTDIKNEYTFSIEDPRSGLNYIRLKQLDFDGQFEYSNIISLNIKRGGEQVGELYPNPNKSGIVNLDYTSKVSENINVSVFDVTGKIILQQVNSIIKGDNKLNFDFSGLNKGIYIVEIGNDSFRTHRRLIME